MVMKCGGPILIHYEKEAGSVFYKAESVKIYGCKLKVMKDKKKNWPVKKRRAGPVFEEVIVLKVLTPVHTLHQCFTARVRRPLMILGAPSGGLQDSWKYFVCL